MTGPVSVPAPLRLVPPEAPDADFETLRSRAIDVVTALAGGVWTDHNPTDPGITLLEAAAWGMADLHYRVARRGLDGWPVAAPSWRPAGRRSWSPAALPEDLADVAAVAAALASPVPAGGSLADALRVPVETSDGPAGALATVLSVAAASGVPLPSGLATLVVGLLRRRLLDRVALDRSATVAGAVDEARSALGPTADPAAVRARAVTILRHLPAVAPLWDDELAALVERQQRGTALAIAVAAMDRIRSASTPAELAALVAELLADGLDPDQAHQAVAGHPQPPGHPPEDWETADGATMVWPPTPDQALRCEPVTGPDYARRARSVPGVRRAWAVPGALPGIAWHGGPTVVTDRPGTITLLVERADPDGPEVDDDFLRRVLAAAVGEVDDPYDLFVRTAPRRVLGEEVGAAVLRRCPVLVLGTLHAAVGADRSVLIAACRARIAAFFAAGRPERQPVLDGAGPGPDGPWPLAPQPAGGWVPGEPVSISELVQVMAADPAVLGVSGVRLSRDGGPLLPEIPSAAVQVPMPAGCVPVLADTDCLRVRLALGAECGDA